MKIPDGYLLVPVHATDAMMDAGVSAARKELPPANDKAPGYVQLRAAWTAMLKTLPTQILTTDK